MGFRSDANDEARPGDDLGRASDERRELLERHGRAYASAGLAIVWTSGLEGDAAKAVTTHDWQTTRPLSSNADYAARYFTTRSEHKNPAVTARTSGGSESRTRPCHGWRASGRGDSCTISHPPKIVRGRPTFVW